MMIPLDVWTADDEYLSLVEYVLEHGVQKGDRTGTGTLSVFSGQMRFDLSDNKIPLLTTKKMYTKGIMHELLWYIAGETNIKYLQENKTRIWDEWADENGDLGPVYGQMWRNWPGKVDNETIDQIGRVIHTLRTNPNDRRMMVLAWNPTYLPDTSLSFSENVALGNCALPPCHALFQFWAHEGELKCQLYQRSCDVGLGVPFNIVQYSMLTHMIAHVTGHEATEFIWSGGDIHIYNNHVEQLNEQMLREAYIGPKFILNPSVTEINDFTYDDMTIEGYNCHPAIKMEVSV